MSEPSDNHEHDKGDVHSDHNPPHFHDQPEAYDTKRQQRVLLLSFILIAGFMVVEAVGGLLTQSLALLSDAGHMLSDAASLGASLLAFKIGEKAANKRKTFGYRRFEILVAGANGAALIIIAIIIFIEAIERLSSPPEVASYGMLIIASIGLLVNLIVAWMLHRSGNDHHHGHAGHNHSPEHSHDHGVQDHALNNHNNDNINSDEKNLNLHSAYLHVLGDILGSIAAIVAALAMIWMGWQWADPVASVIVAVLILVSGYRVVKASTHILMQGAPEGISLEDVARNIKAHDAVISVHDLHLWSITSGIHSMSCHVVVDDDMPISQASQLIHDLEHVLKELGISHTTIQVESRNHPHNRLEMLTCTLSD